MKLTKLRIDAMKYEGKFEKAKDVRWDDELPGFGVRVWPSGRKTFVLHYRFQGRQRYITIGDYGELTLDQARKAALLKKAEVLTGVDPLAVKKKALRGDTVKDLAALFVERHAKVRKKTWEKDQDTFDLYILPALGTFKVAGVTRRDVVQLHQKIGAKHPTTANRVLSLLSSMFNRAKDWGVLPEMSPNPAKRIPKFPEKKRDRFVTKDEMPRLAKAIDAEPNVWIKALIWLYLFTGMRKSELMTLPWKNVDMKRGEVRLTDTKAGRPHYLPLSSAAVYVLEQIPRMAGNPYVFCGARRGRHLVNVKDAWLRIRKSAELEDVRLHDLRRTVGSWMAQSGASLPLIGRVLNHSNVSTTQVYARFHQDPVAEALEAHGKAIREATGLHVVSLPSEGACPGAERARLAERSDVD